VDVSKSTTKVIKYMFRAALDATTGIGRLIGAYNKVHTYELESQGKKYSCDIRALLTTFKATRKKEKKKKANYIHITYEYMHYTYNIHLHTYSITCFIRRIIHNTRIGI
jgi:hypothetical protein